MLENSLLVKNVQQAALIIDKEIVVFVNEKALRFHIFPRALAFAAERFQEKSAAVILQDSVFVQDDQVIRRIHDEVLDERKTIIVVLVRFADDGFLFQLQRQGSICGLISRDLAGLLHENDHA